MQRHSGGLEAESAELVAAEARAQRLAQTLDELVEANPEMAPELSASRLRIRLALLRPSLKSESPAGSVSTEVPAVSSSEGAPAGSISTEAPAFNSSEGASASTGQGNEQEVPAGDDFTDITSAVPVSE